MPKSLQLPSGYPELLQDLKGRIRTAQVRAAFAVSRELVLLYWSIGRDLSQRFGTEKWGGKIVERLAHDLQAEFPGVKGFRLRNLRYMRSLAEAWPEPEILQQLIAKLPWGPQQFCNSPLPNWILNNRRTLWAGTGPAQTTERTS